MFFAEGSEDEIEVSAQNLEDLSMEKDMVPPQSETIQQFSSPHYIKEIYSHKIEDITADNILAKRNNSDDVFINFKTSSNHLDQHTDDMRNGNVDIFYLRAREIILASGSLPSDLELRETGVFTKITINKGTRYGPFQGKWASVPQDARFAWEVSFYFIFILFLIMFNSKKFLFVQD